MDEIPTAIMGDARRLCAYFPYRVVYIVNDGSGYEAIAPKDKRPVNKILRNGGQAYEIKKDI